MATVVLASQTGARITAIDVDEGALARLRGRSASAGFGDRIDARFLDMGRLPVPDRPFDVIWAEGSAYIIGVDRALDAWRPLLRNEGILVLSDMVWRTGHPSEEERQFWGSEYPAMRTVSRQLEQVRRAAYRVLSHFDMGQPALDAYYRPLEARLHDVEGRMEGKRVLEGLRRELRAYH